MMTTWRTVEIASSPADAEADLVLLAGPPLTCIGPDSSCQHAMRAVRDVELATEVGRSFDVLACTERSARTLILGIGPALTLREAPLLRLGALLIDAMNKHRLRSVRVPSSTALGGHNALEALLLGALLRSYGRDRESQLTVATPRKVATLVVDRSDESCVQHAQPRADAINRARAWVERAPNLLTPIAWIDDIRQVFESCGATVRVLDDRELAGMGAGALLAVGRGAEHGSHLLAAEYRGNPESDRWDAVIVGKGLTFDAGGLNLKTRPNISKMKLDMAGGAGVLGALELAIRRQAHLNLAALVPIAENMIDSRSFRPGDVVTSLSRLTIEVADTDYEGRLALADALTYGLRTYQPAWIVDVATLTTAVTGILHEEFAALYASDDRLAGQLVQAGELTGERLWRMPLDDSQNYLAASDVADLRNIGEPGFFGFGSSSPTAGAVFLRRFAPASAWAHIDITGTAWSTRSEAIPIGKGATGYGTRLLDQWLALLETG